MLKYNNLEAWDIFLKVAEQGSFAKAAEILQIEPSNISREVALLESSLGDVSLFNRSTRPITLTEVGKNTYTYAKNLVTLQQEMLEQINVENDMLSGVIRLGIPPGYFDWFLLPEILDFWEKYPEIKFEITDYRNTSVVDFNSPTGNLDIVLTYGPQLVKPGIIQLKYADDVYFLCASPEYLKGKEPILTPEDLLKHTGIIKESLHKKG